MILSKISLFIIIFELCFLNVASLQYLTKRLNEWTFLTTHNSHVNWDDSSVVTQLTNQDVNIDKQLEFGVRGFMFDIDWKTCSSIESFFKNCKCEGTIKLILI